ncbi:MIF4G domain-containing protein / MA3 domain-containing protein [Prunus dulcis]|uniref:MIF4G domain-containing protein / MA3 domain-containing protein n=1 Tax=Prunus dulcis TaxID=3755 RepID=A0A4Y1QVR2_PRUDU|nr:MIF4G domain-containing protein / MA3 domain-containing protein [Prunus dulcis]
MEKSRREKRKEARLSKNARNHESWLQHKKIQKDKAIFVKSKTVQKTKDEHTAEETEVKARSESPEQKDHKVSKAGEEDLELERKLAKKLKVKDGKLKGEDFGLNVLFEGISAVDSLGEKEATYVEALPAKQSKSSSSGKKCKKDKPLKDRLENELPSDLMVEVPEVAVTNGVEVESEDVSSKISLRKKHKKRKLLEGTEEAGDMSFDVSKKMKSCATEMALEKAPVKAPEKYVAPHLRSRAGNEPEEHSQIRRRVRGLLNRLSESNVESITGDLSAIFRSLPRGIASQMFSEELLASCAGGPRGNEQYAAVFAALVAGMACSVGIDFGAKLMASLAKTFEDEYHKEDNISLRNNRVNELKASYGDNQDNTNSKRMEFMLETICDIKNNKKRSKEDNAQHTRIKKWLQKLRVEDILIRGLKWSKLLDSNKKGQWWLSGDMASSTDNVEEVANTIDKEVLEAQKMLQLAAEQRMNTDARKAIFCIIMSGEDYIDAFEKLLRLDLQGKQDREIMRVIVECCLQEKVFNKYYTTLASKFCEHDKNHKFTLQFCLWDHFKDLESMQLTRSMHLAKFVAEMVSSFTLSLAVLKTVDLADIKQLTAKRIMHFRMLFEAIFEYPDSLIWNIFTRVAVSPELESLRRGIEFFVKYIVETNKALKDKFKLAKKALNNVEGVLM